MDEAGLVMVLYALGEALEGIAGAARHAANPLEVAPNEAIVLRPADPSS